MRFFKPAASAYIRRRIERVALAFALFFGLSSLAINASAFERPASPAKAVTASIDNKIEKQSAATAETAAPKPATDTTKKNQPEQTPAKSTGKSTGKSTATKKNKAKKRHVYRRSGICKDLDKLARQYGLPPLFFARLIWQESGFNPYAVSPAGAEGIAQFMPGTAAIWGLEDPFEPGQALIKSAQYLAWLRRKLGNLGLAAAGYNAGSQRVKNWLNGKSFMPLETRNYVRVITGFTVEEWAEGKAEFVGIKVRKKMAPTACKQLSIALRTERGYLINASLSPNGRKGKGARAFNRKNMRRKKLKRLPRLPWGVQLAGSFSRGQAMRQFRAIKRKYGRVIGSKRIVLRSTRKSGRGRRLFHRVRVGAKSRTAANNICKRLRAAGGSCVVLKN